MKGKITVYYEMPKLALYLEKAGNRVTEKDVEGTITEMLSQAVALHMNEESETVSGTLMEMFSTTDGTGTFKKMPTDALHIYFGNDEAELSTFCDRVKSIAEKYLQHSVCEDAASLPEKADIHRENLENLLLVRKNKNKIQELFDGVYGNLYEKMTNNDDYRTSIEESIAKNGKTKIIFLDFDGVLNNAEYKVHTSCTEKQTAESDGKLFSDTLAFDPAAIKRLNHIVDETGAKIVVTSSWRYLGIGKLQEIWKQHGLHGKIIDITSLHAVDEFILEHGLEWLENGYEGNDMATPRSMEIEHWLQSKNSDLFNYVILDDTPMPSTLQPYFVQVNPAYGLLDPQAEKAIRMLND
ncbi:MAG: hypothetical protein J5651_05090 [Salinivirgaceae bacterium]|nr:hypothetical protein [Salinivirgaceae bacterium]